MFFFSHFHVLRFYSYIDVVLELSDARESIFEPSESELVIGFSTVEDITLNRELSCEMKDRFTVSFTLLLFQTPFVSKLGHGLLDLVKFTVNSKRVSDPYSTNANGLIHLDRVEKTDDGNVVFYKGNDVIVLNIQDDKNCSHAEEARMREDINQISGREFHKTDYPLPFNYWGCDGLGWNVSFCQKLKEHECELQRVGNDVCTQSQMTERHYCPASVSLVNATGYLYDTMSKYIPSFPLVSFEGEYHDKHHSTGIVYPCLT